MIYAVLKIEVCFVSSGNAHLLMDHYFSSASSESAWCYLWS